MGALAILVTASVVVGAYITFLLILGHEQMPTLGIFVKIAAISLSVFVCGKLVADVIDLTRE